jgi:hypothetical protein
VGALRLLQAALEQGGSESGRRVASHALAAAGPAAAAPLLALLERAVAAEDFELVVSPGRHCQFWQQWQQDYCVNP